MAQIKSRKHQRTASFVALAATLPLMAHATTATEEVTQLPEITVKSQAENKYKTNLKSRLVFCFKNMNSKKNIVK